MGDNELTDEALRKQLIEDVIFLQGMFTALCDSPEIRRIYIYGTLKLRAYLEGNLSEVADDKSLTEELMRSYQ